MMIVLRSNLLGTYFILKLLMLNLLEPHTQGNFETCADILICDRTPPKVTIEPTIPYTNVNVFREKDVK
jgi:hypothetical protein